MSARSTLFLLALSGSCATSPPPAAPPPAAPPPTSSGPNNYGVLTAISTRTGESSRTATPLTEEVCAGLLAIDPQQPQYGLQIPRELSDGQPVNARYKLLVTSDGEVFGVEVVERPRMNAVAGTFIRRLMKWRYRPHLVAGKPVHFTCPVRIEAR